MSGSAAGQVEEGTLLWEPSEDRRARANLTRYLAWLEERRGLAFSSYDELWRWSVTDLEAFWGSIWEFCDVRASPGPRTILRDRRVPGAGWFEGAELNYAEHAMRGDDDHPALLSTDEGGAVARLSHGQLRRQVASVAAELRRQGVGKGDRVVAYLPNIPEAVVAFLATASIGAIWSACSPDFGAASVVDRFRQIEPAALFAVDGYTYGGKPFDRRQAVARIRDGLPTLRSTVLVPLLGEPAAQGMIPWEEFASPGPDAGPDSEPAFEPVPFDHPLWVLYSSGTTGLPKAIVQGHGGILLEHLKSLTLHLDLSSSDRLFWFTSTGWMVWNWMIGALLVGGTAVTYDGSPIHPDLMTLWSIASRTGTTYLGVSAPFLQGCMKAGLSPGVELDLSAMKTLGTSGAPLPPEGYAWVYEQVKSDLLVDSASGGTDVCTAFVASVPLLPVRAGEIQCRCLGAKVEAFDEEGRSVVDEVGELVLTEPMPSMPLFFWNDPDGSRYHESYFDTFPGVWRHGDWIKITPRGSSVIYGRSDSTLNRAGVRMGTSEFYRVVERMPEVADSLVVDTGRLGAEGDLLLFVVLAPGAELDDGLVGRLAGALRAELSPRHVPSLVRAIPEVPRTLNGKKLEVPVKRLLAGIPPERAFNPDAMANPESIDFFVELAGGLPPPPPAPRLSPARGA